MAYFSNGTEGTAFDMQCSVCKYGSKPCPIALLQVTYNYDQVGNDLARKILNDLVNDGGSCAMFIAFKDDFFEDADTFYEWPIINNLRDEQRRDWVNENWERIPV